MKPSLVVLAAGMGSRYGGVKQIEPVGPHGEIILEYSVFDALRAGFGKVVFVIRRDIEDEFVNHVMARFSKHIHCEYVFQDLTDLPKPFSVPDGRVKPWGTGHAILVCENKIAEPFAVINADDFYGRDAYRVLGAQLSRADPGGFQYAMVGYWLRNTMSRFGTVSRGICSLREDGYLQSVVEHTKIGYDASGQVVSTLPDGTALPLTGEEVVSMNLFGFSPTIFAELKKQFAEFLEQRRDDLKAELYIPSVANRAVQEGTASLKVLHSHAVWFGITYKEDLPSVKQGVNDLVRSGEYTPRLWDGV